MNEQYSALKGNVRMLGQLLGKTIKNAHGEEILEKVEQIRTLSKAAERKNDKRGAEEYKWVRQKMRAYYQEQP